MNLMKQLSYEVDKNWDEDYPAMITSKFFKRTLPHQK